LKTGLKASDSEETKEDKEPLYKRSKTKGKEKSGKLQKKDGAGSGFAPKTHKEAEKGIDAAGPGSASVTHKETEKTGTAPATPPGETIPEKDLSIPADMEKIVEVETPKVGAEAPVASQSKDSGAGYRRL